MARINLHLSINTWSVATSFASATMRITGRQGATLVVKHEGLVGLGDVCPLPGYSDDTLNDCLHALQELVIEMRSPLSLDAVKHEVSKIPFRLPAARFGLECALLDLLAQQEHCSITVLLEPERDVPTSHPRCRLLGIDAGDEAIGKNQRCLKLKVGKDWKREHKRIVGLRSDYPNSALRIDVNGAWFVQEALDNLHSLEGLGLEFVEQPVPPGQMHKLVASPVPLAADESMRTEASRQDLLPLIGDGSLVAVVLKPTILGGLFSCMTHAQVVAAQGVASIASHCFEGAAGTAAVSELAIAIAGPFAAGVDKHTVVRDLDIPQLARLGVVSPHAPGLGVSLIPPESL